MKVTKYIALIGLLAMTGVIAYGFMAGDFSSDGAELLANPWGVVSLVDLYVGFTVFSMWIAFREANVVAAVIWIIFMMGLGSFTACLYVLYAIGQSRGDWLRFFMGSRSYLASRE